MKFRIIGALNLMFALLQFITVGIYGFFTVRNLEYSETVFGSDKFLTFYIYPLLALVLGLVNLFFSFVNFGAILRSKQERVFGLSVSFLLIYVFLVSLVVKLPEEEVADITYSL